MEKLKPITLFLLRVGLGVIFMYNGHPKFVGRRLEHIDEMVHINRLPACFVHIAGVLELGGGAMLAGRSVHTEDRIAPSRGNGDCHVEGRALFRLPACHGPV
jgi:hypothetical protein